MQIVDDMVVFKSNSEYYMKEEEGKKPNTMRMLSVRESQQIFDADMNERVKRIRIVLDSMPEFGELSFERELTDISYIGYIAGKMIYIFSWRHK